MARVAYVNGRYVPHQDAMLPVEDRAVQFADAVYEVIAVCGGVMVDGARHLDRLAYSLGQLEMAWPMPRRALTMVLQTVIARNHIRIGSLYVQVSRGVWPRDFKFPRAAEHPGRPAPVSSLIVTGRRGASFGAPAQITNGVAVCTVADQRWDRRDIKSTGLLAQVLAKEAAVRRGSFEAWLLERDGRVTEGASSNAWIVDAGGTLITHPANGRILNGVTRLGVLEIAAASGIPVIERPFTVAEAGVAREAFLTSTTSFVLPIVRIDDLVVGDGRPGPVTTRLRQRYCEQIGYL